MQQLLRSKLGECKFTNTSLCKSKSSYENIKDAEFFIFDPPNETNQPVRIVKSKVGEHQLKVSNPDEKEICVVKIDKCLFPMEVSKCDCILFSTENFYFVEIKDSKTSQRHTSRKRAVEQLGATLDNFNDHGIDLTTFVSKAVICFRSLSPYPIRTSFLTEKAVFQEKYNISLEEGNKIEF